MSLHIHCWQVFPVYQTIIYHEIEINIMIVRDQACFNNYNEKNVVSSDQSHLIKRHGCVNENL